MYLHAELRALPDQVYSAVMERLVELVCGGGARLLALVPCLVQVELVKCKVGVSQGSVVAVLLEYVTCHVHVLEEETVNRYNSSCTPSQSYYHMLTLLICVKFRI